MILLSPWSPGPLPPGAPDETIKKVSLNFSGNQPRVAWSLHAPPGHPLEGEVLDSNVFLRGNKIGINHLILTVIIA